MEGEVRGHWFFYPYRQWMLEVAFPDTGAGLGEAVEIGTSSSWRAACSVRGVPAQAVMVRVLSGVRAEGRVLGEYRGGARNYLGEGDNWRMSR